MAESNMKSEITSRDQLLNLIERAGSLGQTLRLHQCRLVDVDCTKIDFTKIDLGAVEFVRCNFFRAAMPGDSETLSVIALADVKFVDCDLTEARVNTFGENSTNYIPRTWHGLSALVASGRVDAANCKLPPEAPPIPPSSVEYIDRQPVMRVPETV